MDKTSKYAYLIIAHKDPYCFHKLIGLLDDERNDIFVHIDKKSDINQFNDVKVDKSHIYFTNRIDIRWGTYSQIQSELILLQTAKSKNNYIRYHLLSGADLPLKSQNQIHDYFDSYPNKEFVGFAPPSSEEDINYKTKYIHIGLKNYKCNSLFKKVTSHFIHSGFVKVQKYLGYNRQRKDITIKKGANWFSITDVLVDYLLSHESQIYQLFHYGFCIDEMFVQTMLWNSPLKNRIYTSTDEFEGCMRLIDWQRGNPWVWKKSDFDTLINSDRMFARKFSSYIDKDIIDSMSDYIKSRQ